MQSGKRSRVAQLCAKIRENGFKCALSGWEISPNSFELDHILSMNDGGTDDISNLQAVHPLVNRAKGTMGNSQFIEMCVAVANHCEGKRHSDGHGSGAATKQEVAAVRLAAIASFRTR